MRDKTIHTLLTYLIATVWVANGLFCKVLNYVPRHEEIVARILKVDRPSANLFSVAIGFCEIFMAVWIVSKIKTKLNALVQILIVAIMNTIEFFLVPDLLLWGKANAIFAFIFILVVYFNEFYLNKRSTQRT